jgi:mRNA-degrading endonuclease RelE of RelBE toxin-antitoxin system
MIQYNTLSSFDKDFKKLHKKFKTLDEDFAIMKKNVIEVYHLKNIQTNAVVKIEGFCSESYNSMKVRKFTSMSLKGRGAASGLRVIYVFENCTCKVTFIEIYFKQDKENEDRDRLKNFIDALTI